MEAGGGIVVLVGVVVDCSMEVTSDILLVGGVWSDILLVGGVWSDILLVGGVWSDILLVGGVWSDILWAAKTVPKFGPITR
jgi:hypothetical protein